MNISGFGDLASSFQLRRDNARLAGDLQRLAGELSSGRKAEIATGQAGDYGPLAALQRDATQIGALIRSTEAARLIAQSGQDVLGRISAGAEDVSSAFLLTVTSPDANLISNAAIRARQEFESAVAGLNTQVAGRSIFAGQHFDGPAVADADAILSDLVTATAGETTAAGVATIIDAYFAPGGGYETTAYLGTSAPESPARLGDGESVEPALLASDDRIAVTLASLAKGALLDLGVLDGLPEERALLAQDTGEDLVNVADDITSARGTVGTAEEQIERASVRLSSEQSATEMALAEILNADPFETATRLQEAEAQLQTLYLMTGRLASLSLSNYLR